MAKKIIKSINFRLIITCIIIILQCVWFVIFWLKLTEYSEWLNTAFKVLSLLMVLYLVKNEENPAYKIAWIILIMAIPVFGTLLYLIFGGKNPTKPMRKRIEKAQLNICPALVQDDKIIDEIAQINPRAASLSRYIARYGYPINNNTATTYYPSGNLMLHDMLQELAKATHYIFMEYFIIKNDNMWKSIRAILVEKAAAGVDVRLMYDDIGCMFTLPKNFAKDMEKQGVKCVSFNPIVSNNRFIPILSAVVNNRDHRKMMIIDGKVAFSGGINIADEYVRELGSPNYWKDTGLRLSGESVWSYTVMFLGLWNTFRKTNEDNEQFHHHFVTADQVESDGYVQPFTDSPLDDEDLSVSVYIDILAQAKNYVYIFTPYLIIDDVMTKSLCAAAKRGVDVRIVTPGTPDKKIVHRLTRSYYAPLLKGGVRIFEYALGFIHAKSYVCDDEIAIVGTINMDYRSLYLHFECGTYLYRTSCIADIKNDALDTFEKSREITLKDCQKTVLGQFIDAVLRVFAPLT